MVKDFHLSKFDEETLIKLDLYRKYIAQWLPVFMTQGVRLSAICLYDLMCGPGVDCDGRPGSPVLLLQGVYSYLSGEQTKNTPTIKIVFNDNTKWKIDSLKETIKARFPTNPKVEIEYNSSKVEDIFPRISTELLAVDAAKFVFIDQCGIKELSEERIRVLCSAPRTDWLYFVASNTIYRFSEHPSIRDKIRICGEYRHSHVHRKVAEVCRDWAGREGYYIIPFSIKKKGNFYGLIFGTGHPRGADKFLEGCWKEDPLLGEANYDIEGESSCSNLQFSLFQNKVSIFQEELEGMIRAGALRTNEDICYHCLQSGFRHTHSNPVLKRLKSKGIIKNKRVPGLSYSTIAKGKTKIVSIELS